MRLSALLCLVFAVGCSSDSAIDTFFDDASDWIDDALASLTENISEATGDFDPSDAPYLTPYAFPSADVTDVSYGFDGDYFYVRVDLADVIPVDDVLVAAAGEVEAQTITGQSFSIAMDTDNSDLTGAGAATRGLGSSIAGVDILFQIVMGYGGLTEVFANWDFAGGDFTLPGDQLAGELGEGGPGYDYFVLRYPIDSIPTFFFPAGSLIEVGGWSDAESDLYEQFVSDLLSTTSWSIPDL